MKIDEALQIMQSSLDSLKESEVIKVSIKVTPELVLLGKGSPFDSLGFVTLMTEMEDRMSRLTGQDIFFNIMEVSNFNIDNPFLSAQAFGEYMISLV
ncbi:outer membrane protein TolC [Leptospira ryugenii]|uniref:Outer membrane protein TolC n=2 Tax=Leptospira ryugenii TaxID=1917863 RepID=A0A2P2DW97_9LEPT|nr:outer membrane protein TolC [Leptospira ryugenii]